MFLEDVFVAAACVKCCQADGMESETSLGQHSNAKVNTQQKIRHEHAHEHALPSFLESADRISIDTRYGRSQLLSRGVDLILALEAR